jgi:hypothetical protein
MPPTLTADEIANSVESSQLPAEVPETEETLEVELTCPVNLPTMENNCRPRISRTLPGQLVQRSGYEYGEDTQTEDEIRYSRNYIYRRLKEQKGFYEARIEKLNYALDMLDVREAPPTEAYRAFCEALYE